MRLFGLRRVGLIALAAGTLAVSFLLRGGLNTLSSTPFPVSPPGADSWSELLSTPPQVTLTPLTTGVSSGDRHTVLDADDPNLDQLRDRFAPSPVLAYHLHHPTQGDYLIDAGLSDVFASGDTNYTALLRLLLLALDAKPHQDPGQSALAQLGDSAAAVRGVFVTHLHADHTSGLTDFDCSVFAAFGRGESTFGQRALLGDHLACHPRHTLDFESGSAVPPFDGVLDLFGDGSVWALSTAGHTPSHVSYLVHAKGGPVLVTGDAVAYYDQLEYRIRPTPGVADPQRAEASLHRIAEFVDRYPEVSVAVGHERPRPLEP